MYFADIPHGQGNGVDIKVPWNCPWGIISKKASVIQRRLSC